MCKCPWSVSYWTKEISDIYYRQLCEEQTNLLEQIGTGNGVNENAIQQCWETACLSHIDNFNAQLMTYFDKYLLKEEK
jgi:hypothetical protein